MLPVPRQPLLGTTTTATATAATTALVALFLFQHFPFALFFRVVGRGSVVVAARATSRFERRGGACRPLLPLGKGGVGFSLQRCLYAGIERMDPVIAARTIGIRVYAKQ
jgi:hypothetical protein